MLIELGIPIDDVDTFGQTPIYYVARENRLSLFHKLVTKGK
jgi:ankyrin repeat protein